MIVRFVGGVVKCVLVSFLLVLGLGYLVSGGSRQTSPAVASTSIVSQSTSTIKTREIRNQEIRAFAKSLAVPSESVETEPVSQTLSDDARIRQAESLFASAADLERMQKPLGAIDTYARIYMRFNGSVEATRAAGEIRRLGGVVPSDLQVQAFQERERTRERRDAEAAEAHAEKKARLELARVQRAEAKAKVEAEAAAARYESSGEHVGPRGGVYHYSKNGKKTYSRKK